MGLSSCISKASDGIKKAAKKQKNAALRAGEPDTSAEFQESQLKVLAKLTAKFGDIAAIDGNREAEVELLKSVIEDLKLDRETVVIQIEQAGLKAPAMPKLTVIEGGAAKQSEGDGYADMESRITIAADSIDNLRKVDVERVLSQGNLDKNRMAEYIKLKRPDLAAEVDDVMAEIGGGNAAVDADPANKPGANLERHQAAQRMYGQHRRAFLSNFSGRELREQEKFVEAAEQKFSAGRIMGFSGGKTVHVTDSMVDASGSVRVFLMGPGGNFNEVGTITIEETALYKDSAVDAAKPAETPIQPSNPEMDELRAEMGQALGELASILGARLNLTPEEETRIIPVMSKIFRIAAKMGYIKFKDAGRFVMAEFRKLAGAEVAGKLSIENLQAGYINIAREIGGDKREAMAYDSIEELEAAQQENENVADKRGSTDLESNRQNAGTENQVGQDGIPSGRDGDGRTGRHGVQGTQGEGRPGGSGVDSGREAAPAGERGDLKIYTGPSDVSGSAPGDRVDLGSRIDGIGRTPAEPDATKATKSAARSAVSLTEAQASASTSPDATIDDALPILSDGQREDVAKAEKRFAMGDGYGMLFTNGTGTGKTFVGLGIIKRFANQGKTNILIIAPNDKIIEDWQKSGRLLGLDISRLADTNDAGKGIVITTYANMGANNALASRDWDLVAHDEAHYLAMDKDGTNTNALKNLRAITLHPDGVYQRHSMQNAEDIERLKQMDADAKMQRTSDDQRDWVKAEETQNKADKLRAELKAKQDAIKEDVAARQGKARPRVLFLSATPFAYEKTVDWANGYLFDYNEGRGDESREFRGYNQGSNKDKFFMQHFGYRMRTGKLTEPDAKVDRGLMQRQFNSWLKKRGALSGRMLDVEADYDRRFILVDSGIGKRIDDALEFFERRRKEHQGQFDDSETGQKIAGIMGKVDPYVQALNAVRDHIAEKFDYLSRRYLLESIKAKEVVPHIREHLAMGRKVVVFHDYKKGGGFNPFILEKRNGGNTEGQKAEIEQWNRVVDEFNREFRDIINSDLFKQSSPIDLFRKEFPGVLLFNGDVPAKDRRANVAKFQDDASGPQVILVQSAAGKEGISLHDTTGKHQRVLFNLGQPTQPTTAIQQEGRIYRTGQATDAIFRYLNTGTRWEQWAFATTIAQRASAAENLGMGEMARALKDAFISGFEESSDYRAGMEGEGKGGKERDKAANEAISEYDRAKAFYFGQQKKTSATKAAEGTDYFATPEPVGFKMMEFADIRPGESVLEPSAGHGAIARWAPESANRTAIEPSMKLRPRLAMVFDGNIIGTDFESHNIVNKYDAIVMNPPFGTGGKTAVDHLAKATQHLRDGGRVVALLPTGPAADKKFDKWFYGEAERELKPLFDHPTLGPIYRGDTVTTRASWMKEGVIVRRDKDGGLWLKREGVSGESMVAPEAFAEVKATGPRKETYRPAANLYMRADIKMPPATFERAGTSVATRIVVIDKVMNKDAAQNLTDRQRDLSDAADIGELFDRIEDMAIPPRIKERVEEEEKPAAKPGRAQKQEARQEALQADQAAADAGLIVNQDKATFKLEGKKIITNAPLREYTTRAGKTLKGVWVPDGKMAKEVDEYTWKAKNFDGNFFVRIEHIQRPNAEEGTSLNQTGVQGYYEQYQQRAIAFNNLPASQRDAESRYGFSLEGANGEPSGVSGVDGNKGADSTTGRGRYAVLGNGVAKDFAGSGNARLGDVQSGSERSVLRQSDSNIAGRDGSDGNAGRMEDGSGETGRGRYSSVAGVAEDFRATGRTKLVGLQIRSPDDLATAAQIYRDPRLETARYFFTKNGEVIGQTAISSRKPGVTKIFPGKTEQDFVRHIDDISEQMRLLGADGVWMLHNHPSGDPRPSGADIASTIRVRNEFNRRGLVFNGHVIINSQRYGFIDPNGKQRVVIKDFGAAAMYDINKPKVAHPLIGGNASTPGHLALIAKLSQKASGNVVVIGLSGGFTTRVISEVSPDQLRGKFGAAILRRIAKQTGSDRLFAYGVSPDDIGSVREAIKTGLLVDAIVIDNGIEQSVAGMPGTESPMSGYSLGTKDVGYRVEQGGAPSVDRATIESIVIDNFRSIIENMKSAKKLTEDCK